MSKAMFGLEGLRGKQKEEKGKLALSLVWLEEGRGEGLIWSKICSVEPAFCYQPKLDGKRGKGRNIWYNFFFLYHKISKMHPISYVTI